MEFYKYQATGNDFIMVDDRRHVFPETDAGYVARLCHRRFGIGADGLILLREAPGVDFHMVYFNADGHPGSMCGNGGRCAAAFARYLGMVGEKCRFLASDGLHEAVFTTTGVSLKMGDVSEVRSKPQYTFLDTGSPHHVQWVEDLEHLDVYREGKRLRYSLYGQAGSNINFVAAGSGGGFRVRTYERGVEDETYSCGTGVTAAVLAMHAGGRLQQTASRVETLGGELQVAFQPGENGGYTDIWLTGPATQVFKGECP